MTMRFKASAPFSVLEYMESELLAKFRCPQCNFPLALEQLERLHKKEEVVVCSSCGTRLRRKIGGDPWLASFLAGGFGWLLTFFFFVGTSYPAPTAYIGEIVGAVVAGATWLYLTLRLTSLEKE